jgi:hypothetical protein
MHPEVFMTTWNETVGIEVLIACAIPLPPPLSVYLEKMATPEKKAFCVLRLRSINQLFLFSGPSGGNFRVIPHLPSAISDNGGCLCKGKSAGRPRVPEESEERVTSLLRSAKKSVRHASSELQMSTVTVWRVLRKRLHFLQLQYCNLPFFVHRGNRDSIVDIATSYERDDQGIINSLT